MAYPAEEEITVAGPTTMGIDSTAVDSVFVMMRESAETAPEKGIIIQRVSETAQNATGPIDDTSISWILTGLILVFLAVCLRFRKNSRYFIILFRDVMEVRERHNAFDDTLRETTFLWLLNLLWCGSAGILLYGLLYPPSGGTLVGGLDIMKLLVCMGTAAAYTIFEAGAYTVVGNLFSSRGKAAVWLKGYLSTQGLESLILFVVALAALCVPGINTTMLFIGAIVFTAAKILFIYKGFCIFFADFASWVLFLYYLCSLELVPIFLAYAGAKYFCGIV